MTGFKKSLKVCAFNLNALQNVFTILLPNVLIKVKNRGSIASKCFKEGNIGVYLL